MVINLSNYVLSPEEENTLNRGLSFDLTKTHDPFEFRTEFFSFMRKVRLNEYFSEHEGYNSNNYSGLRNALTFCAPNHSHTAESTVFERQVLAEVRKLETCVKSHNSNFSKRQRASALKLAKDKNLIIRQADKGGAIVLMNRSDYIKECERLLSDNVSYLKLTGDPTARLTKIIKENVTLACDSEMISKQESEFLTREQGRIPVFYILPKVHKGLVDPPGRPIVSGVNSILEPLSKFADFYLRPFVLKMQSYLRDTTDAINKIENIEFVPGSSLLIGLDIQSLYTMISQRATLEVVEEILLGREDGHPVSSAFISWCTEFALTQNFFQFQGTFFNK
ncbi:uncharacterized protein [Ambystoma mexicanum]|uniref:uncharacterized protein n=1 Tax=Ambystoma mexicanum TaxID=8296 RepID=UPI0037E99A2A